MIKSSPLSISIISLLWGMSLFAYSPVCGQSLAKDATAFNNDRIILYQYSGEYTRPDTLYKKKKWNGEYIGGGLLLIGLGVGLFGAVDATVHQDLNGNGTLTPAQNTTFLEIALAGFGFLFAGAATIGSYEEHHKIAITSSGNQVGIAYNFR